MNLNDFDEKFPRLVSVSSPEVEDWNDLVFTERNKQVKAYITQKITEALEGLKKSNLSESLADDEYELGKVRGVNMRNAMLNADIDKIINEISQPNSVRGV